MSEAEIYADPERILGLAEELKTFVDSLRNQMERMAHELQALGGTWRDGEYEKFKRSFERVKNELAQVEHEITRRDTELKEDARLLLAYLRKTQ